MRKRGQVHTTRHYRLEIFIYLGIIFYLLFNTAAKQLGNVDAKNGGELMTEAKNLAS